MTAAQLATEALKSAHLSMQDAKAIVISSTDHVLTKNTRAVFIGGAGNLKVVMASGNIATLTGVLAGSYLPLSISKVFKTGTTATNITALF